MPRLSHDARSASWFVAGPTASGKSDVALALVDLLRDGGGHPEIVALDSMTLYRGMDIGTAKPSLADQAMVPHHLFDVLDVDESFTVADYVVAADRVCREILSRGGTPIFVGGTGLYLRSLLRGVFEGPPRDATIRDGLVKRAEIDGREALHKELTKVDAPTAARLSPNDVRRVVRALEVFQLSGRPLSEWQQEDEPDTVAMRVFWLEPERSALHERINSRVDRMLAAGWLGEARNLKNGEREIGQTASQALGYKELFDVLEGTVPLADSADVIKARTRQFAKRQHTWFRNLEECVAVSVGPADSAKSVAKKILTSGMVHHRP